MTRANHISASSIAAFKKCPQAYRLAYLEGIRQEHDADVLRTGSSWHGMHEAYATGGMDGAVAHLNQRYSECPPWVEIADWQLERQILLVSFVGYQWYWQNDNIDVLATELPFDLPLHEPTTGLPCSTKSVLRVGKVDQVGRWHGAVVAVERKSTSKSVEADSDFWTRWAKDTQISFYALAAQDMMTQPNALTAAVYGPYFELPLSQGKVAIVDEADRKLVEEHPWHVWTAENQLWYAATNIKIDGEWVATRLHRLLMGEEGEHIDHINGNTLDNRRCNLRPATRSLNRLNSDTRGTSFHKDSGKWVARIMLDGKSQSLGYFETELEANAAYIEAKAKILPPPTGERFGNTLIDCWSKPKTKPAMLTQAETKAFIESGEYCGTKFEVSHFPDTPTGHSVSVNGILVAVEPGKKGFAIRESVEMYGARLLEDIYANPSRYFARREVGRTADEIRKFRGELFSIYQNQSYLAKSGNWFSNESACDSPYRCAYKPICYGAGADQACEGVGAPLGFKRLPYADFRVNGVEVDV